MPEPLPAMAVTIEVNLGPTVSLTYEPHAHSDISADTAAALSSACSVRHAAQPWRGRGCAPAPRARCARHTCGHGDGCHLYQSRHRPDHAGPGGHQGARRL